MMLSVPACIPPNTLVNFSNLEAGANGRSNAVYWSSSADSIGKHYMEAQGVAHPPPLSLPSNKK
ncbi:MAG: hypothetical protein J7K66_07260 [Anaerolineaceae bacterium]|nr:hypothetical protein [Anaerolineaceae bacterium]